MHLSVLPLASANAWAMGEGRNLAIHSLSGSGMGEFVLYLVMEMHANLILYFACAYEWVMKPVMELTRMHKLLKRLSDVFISKRFC